MSIDYKYINQRLNAHIPSPEGVCKYSSVLMPIFEGTDDYEFLFCKRAMTLSRQPGDICFPGGRREGNETHLETALRETWEEIGIPRGNIQILGETDFVVTTYGAVIKPFVALIKGLSINDLHLNYSEVDEIFTVPLSFFINTEPEEHSVNIRFDVPEDFPFEHIAGGRNYPWSRGSQPEPFYFYNNRVIWGFTARIIKNFCSIIKGELA